MLFQASNQHLKDEKGNLVRFDQVYDTYFDQIFRYVLYRVPSIADAEDLTSKVFFKALRAAPKLNRKGISIQAWLYRIASNEVASLFRSRKHTFLPLEDIDPTDPLGPDTEMEEAHRELQRKRMFLELNQCIRELKSFDQHLITLRFFQNKTFREIAEITGKREGSVTMRTHRALEKLQKQLDRRGMSYERFRESFNPNPQTGYSSAGVQAEVAP